MAAVNVGSVWNFQDRLVVISVPIKCVPGTCYPGDLRSRQFRDLPMGKYEMLPVSHKLIKTTQFFQDHGPSPHLCRSGCNWRSGVTGRSPKVKRRHNPFFSPISRDRMEIETRKWCQAIGSSSRFRSCAYWPTWVMMWPWSYLTWSQIFKLTFQGQKVHVSNRLDEANTMVSFLFSFLPYRKSYQWKMTIFHVMNSEAKIIDLRSNLIKKASGAWGVLPNAFFEFFLAIILLEIIAIVCEKIAIFSKFDLWLPLVT